MKIYAETSQPELDQYIGKDVWIKCFRHGSVIWTRIIDAYYAGDEFCFYYVNELSESEVHRLLHPMGYYSTGFDSNHIPARVERRRDINEVTPIETMTTQELFGLSDYSVDTDTSDLFEQLAGTNIWVRAENVHDLGNEYYIHIVKKDGNTITYDKIDTYLVEDPTGVDTMGGPPSEREEIYSLYEISHIDTWEVVDPNDVLTTEEVEAAFNEGESFWWDYYNNHIDEFYDGDEGEE